MGKTKRKSLIEDIADEFNTYLDKGVRFDSIAGDVDPNLAIEDLETLLRVHFVLTHADDDSESAPGVIDFVQHLPDRIRRLKTTVTKDTQVHRGEIRGRIDWHQTIKTRYQENYADGTKFACQQSKENYDIEENLVLRQLIAIIHEIVFEDLEYALENETDYEWLGEWVDDDHELRTGLKDVFRENVYLQRIDTDEVRITDRMIESVKKSRTPLYREAALLLDRYRRLMAYDLDSLEAKELLQNTFVAPEKTDTLFELYWIFRILGTYDGVQFELLGGDDPPNLVACWTDDEWEYRLFHDATGTVEFSETVSDVTRPEDDGYLYRSIAVTEEWQQLSDDLFDRNGSDGLWGGRPDIVLEKRSLADDALEEVFVGEVKYTQDTGYAAQGLRELLEYVAYIKHDGGADSERGDDESYGHSDENGYVESKDDLFDFENVRGLLFVDDIGTIEDTDSAVTAIRPDDELDHIL